MSKRYKITLIPLNRFYFGGETSFSVKDKENGENKNRENEENISYIVSSSCFPQQTSLLGMMRFAILSHNPEIFKEGKIIAPKGAKEWIGEESFSVREDGKEKNYGKIAGISSCFLQIRKSKVENEKQVMQCITLYPAPMDREWKVDFLASGTNWEGCKVGELLCIHGVKTQKLPVINGYDPKVFYGNKYVGDGYVLQESEIFIEDSRIGIRRDNQTGKTLDEAYYKQKFYRFADQIRGEKVEIGFVFETVLKEYEFGENFSGCIVQLGGDGSKFRLEAKFIGEMNEEKKPIEKLPVNYWGNNASRCYSKAVLLSDAYLDSPDCLFNISETKVFRFLKTSIEGTKEYYKFRGENTPSKKDKYNLYRRGSVFYFENKKQQDAFEIQIQQHEEFRQIGYNNYRIIKY